MFHWVPQGEAGACGIHDEGCGFVLVEVILNGVYLLINGVAFKGSGFDQAQLAPRSSPMTKPAVSLCFEDGAGVVNPLAHEQEIELTLGEAPFEFFNAQVFCAFGKGGVDVDFKAVDAVWLAGLFAVFIQARPNIEGRVGLERRSGDISGGHPRWSWLWQCLKCPAP